MVVLRERAGWLAENFAEAMAFLLRMREEEPSRAFEVRTQPDGSVIVVEVKPRA